MSEDRFRLLFEHSSDAHIIFSDGGITDCNEATVRLLKCGSKNDVLNLHPAVLSPPYQPDGRSSAEKSKEMDALALKNGFHRFEWVHRKVNGEDFPVQVTLNALKIGGKDSMIAVWHDLTELKQKEERLLLANEKFKNEMDAAVLIQKSMLPISSPRVPGFRAAWAFKPCGDLGGDILNVFPLDEKHVGLYVLDVTGHGVSAALLSVAASHFLSPFSETSFVRSAKSGSGLNLARPHEVADKLNRHFCSNPDFNQFFTLLYGVLNVETLEFCYVCAGHPLPIVVSNKGRARQAAGSGFPIGVTQDFEYSELCLKLSPGDRLYLYSDGITEARNAAGDMYGIERLMDLVSRAQCKSLSDCVDGFIGNVESWCRPQDPDDDITLLACELTGHCSIPK